MREFVDIVVLGIIQGLTEFLPISSDGHLVVGRALLTALGSTPWQDPLGVTLVLHLGTLLAVLVAYRRDVLRLLGSDRRTIPLLIVGTIPAVIFGLLIESQFEAWLEDPLLTGCGLLITAGFLLWGARAPAGDLPYQQLTYRQALLIGVFQASAVLPGISRSGTTISSGLALGLRRADAATFSFLLSIPAVGGAFCYKALKMFKAGSAGAPLSELAVGAVVSLLVGLIAIWWLLAWLARGKIYYFAYWCIPLGMAVIVWAVTKSPG